MAKRKLLKKGVPGKHKSNNSSALPAAKIDRTEAQQQSDKLVALAVEGIEKDYGKGTVMRLGDNRMLIPKSEVVSSGSLGLDIALGIGGVPRGRIVEIFGPESSGKTTLSLSIVAQAQAIGLRCAFVDAEHALDPAYASVLGVNTDDLLVSQPDYGEQALEIVNRLASSTGIGVIVVDSVAALTPKAELEGEMGDAHMGLQARLMSQAMRKLTATVGKSKTMVVFINQTRMKIGVFFGNPETTSGGQALKFYTSVRLKIERIGAVKKGEETIGNRTRVRVVKNKCSPPFKKAEFDLIYGKGINRVGEILDVAIEQGVVDKSGAWFSYGKERIGQGRDNVCSFLADNPTLLEQIRKQVIG